VVPACGFAEALQDVLAWVMEQQKKERPRDKPTVG
jgi:hypothetical protein